MGRRRIYRNWKHPPSLVHTIEALIIDYPRRERIIRYSSASELTLEEYRRLNGIIDNAVESVEPDLAKIVKCDIVERIGFDKSRASLLASKCTYYNRKRLLIHDVAVSLHLVDE